MKNIALFAALAALGGPLASADQTTVVMPMSATVANVCTYAPYDGSASTSGPITPAGQVGPAYNLIDVNGKTYTQGTANLGTYKANAASANGSRNLYIHRCTSFTNFAPEATSGTVVLRSAGSDNASHAEKLLNVSWTLDTNGSANDVSGVGDVHYGNVTFTVPAGQWNAAAGQYTGKLTLNLNYN